MPKTIKNDELYLQVHGLTVKPDRLNRYLVEAIDQMRRTLYGESATELTEAELRTLETGGFITASEPATDPSAAAAAAYAALLSTSIDTQTAAKRLGVKSARVRQMLAKHNLYGIRIEGRWHIPEFQFWQQGLVPGIGQVFYELGPELHPLTVFRWFTRPQPDLETEDSDSMSPLKWLREGHSVGPVLALARHL